MVYDSFFPQGVHIINLPDSLLEIGYATFAGLPEGVQFTIPTGVTKVGSYAFASCGALTELPYLPNVTTIWQFTYANCKNLQEAVIPQGVTYIGEYAFAADYALTEVNFPDTLQIIDKYAFSGFEGCPITMLKLPESLLRIREGAFRNVPITSLTIPSKVWEIGIDAFGYNEHLTTVKIEGQVDEFNGFAGCGNLKELTISARQVFAGSTVFSPLETIVLKENVKKVSEAALWLNPGADI
ncbi:MAG: leucine-rich repeat domain-containing protein [Acetatifactor sp.]|nr:leucine-rich repeat domain-containing protein [Acetatifactor sp.]